jgi:hypothetical protein
MTFRSLPTLTPVLLLTGLRNDRPGVKVGEEAGA